MQRQGIVYGGLDTGLCHVRAEPIPVCDSHHILVPDVFGTVGRMFRLDYRRIVNKPVIDGCQISAVIILAVGIWEFDSQYRCLYGIEAAVEAGIYIVVLAVGAVIALSLYGGCELRIGCSHGSGIAYGADVFGRIETESGGIAECAGFYALP